MSVPEQERRSCFAYGAVREGLSEEMTPEQGPEASRGGCGYLGRSLRAEGTASAKDLRSEQAWSV